MTESQSLVERLAGEAALTEDDVHTLIGHAVILKADGQTDMPRYFAGLALRIAAHIGVEKPIAHAAAIRQRFGVGE